jgi:hypothetical protein
MGLMDFIMLKVLDLKGFHINERHQVPITCVSKVETAAPMIPKRGINQKFKIILKRTIIALLYSLYTCKSSLINHIPLARACDIKIPLQTQIING